MVHYVLWDNKMGLHIVGAFKKVQWVGILNGVYEDVLSEGELA